MKANYTEFETKLTIADCGGLFRTSVDRRPLKLKAVRFEYFTPTSAPNAFAAIDDSIEPDFEVGARYQLAELLGTVVMSCLDRTGSTYVSLRSTGNMRGRSITNSLVKHLVKGFKDADSAIRPETYSDRL